MGSLEPEDMSPEEIAWAYVRDRPPMEAEMAAMIYLEKQWHQLTVGERALLLELARLRRTEDWVKDFIQGYRDVER